MLQKIKKVVFRRGQKVNLVIRVDPQLERHSSSKLVSFTSLRDVVGIDLALNVDIFIVGNIKELDCNQRLRVVYLQKNKHTNKKTVLTTPLNTGECFLSGTFNEEFVKATLTKQNMFEAQSYLSFLAIVRVVHKIESPIWRVVRQLSNFVRIFSLKGKKTLHQLHPE